MSNTLAICSNLRSIGQLVLGGLSGDASSSGAFKFAFQSCTNLTGESAKVFSGGNIVPLYERVTVDSGDHPYSGGDTGLSDWAAIVQKGWN
jgi:hypothetical protein